MIKKIETFKMTKIPQNHLNDQNTLKLLNWPKIFETFKITKSFGLFLFILRFQGYFGHFDGFGSFLVILKVQGYLGHFRGFWIYFLVILEVKEYFGHFRDFKRIWVIF